uniref:Putative dna repair protein n=1 Tax=Panstrongylus megistus TaxID=65343 RepID=A0A069DW05_9HEMI
MAPIKIERVVSVSSEDEAHAAANLLKNDYSNKKWKCRTPGEKQISVVFQLAECCKISSIDIGNEHSAFIEILVGKSCSPDDEYKVLLVTSSLMTLQEAKYGTNINGVSFFKKESLCKPECDEKWDRIKIVCTQPFNKHAQYGLSFIVLHGETTLDTNSSQLGNFQMKATASVEPLLKVGGLFANRNKLTNDPPISTGAAAIRAASLSGDVKADFKGKVSYKDHDAANSPEMANANEEKQKKKRATPKNEEKTKKRTDTNGNTTPSTNTKATHSAHTKTGGSNSAKKVVRASVQAFKKRKERPFGNLMAGVAFVISGYENPLRSELRNKALAMGAKYEANWNRNCTHLICAFRNTPKYHQVRGQGKIVKREWIEECYSRRARLPWRRFALDTNEASQPESEEEIHELAERSTPVKKRSARRDSSDGDTDDEIEKVRQKQRKQNGCIPSTSGASSSSHNNTTNLIAQVSDNGINNSSSHSGDSDQEGNKDIVAKETILKDKKEADDSTTTSSVELKIESIKKEETSVYDMDTESEGENYWIKNKPEESTLPPLPAFFQGATIALLDDLSEMDRKLLTRYIKAHQGTIANDGTDLNTILYAITEDLTAIERVREDYPQVIGVTPEWIWRSHDEARLLPASTFKV